MQPRRMTDTSRFAAKLLFQYRVGKPANSKFRICEERIVVLRKNTPESALSEANRIGESSQTDFLNDEGETVAIEFVGVLDLMNLGLESEPNEVWYEIKTMLRPVERRKKLIPPKEKLSAFRIDRVRLD